MSTTTLIDLSCISLKMYIINLRTPLSYEASPDPSEILLPHYFVVVFLCKIIFYYSWYQEVQYPLWVMCFWRNGQLMKGGSTYSMGILFYIFGLVLFSLTLREKSCHCQHDTRYFKHNLVPIFNYYYFHENISIIQFSGLIFCLLWVILLELGS